jgi:hypothetical protein
MNKHNQTIGMILVAMLLCSFAYIAVHKDRAACLDIRPNKCYNYYSQWDTVPAEVRDICE